MSNRLPAIIGVGSLVAFLTGCTHEGPLWEIDEIESFDQLAERFPGAAPLLEQAGPLPVSDAQAARFRPAVRVRLLCRWRLLQRGVRGDL